MKEEKHLEMLYGGLRENIGMKTYLHGPTDDAKKKNCVLRGPGPTRKKKEIYQKSGGGGRGCTHMPVWHNNKE